MARTPKSAEKKTKKKEWVAEAAIYSALRRAYRSSPAVTGVLEAAKEEYFIPSKKGTQMRRVRYTCAKCGLKNPKSVGSGKKKKFLVAVDHIQPVVDPLDGNLLPTGERDWNKQIKRLILLTPEGLQILCKECHKVKSAAENALRREVKKEKKS